MNQSFKSIFYILSIALTHMAFSVCTESITPKGNLAVITAKNIEPKPNVEIINPSVIQEESKVIANIHNSYAQNKLFYKNMSDATIALNINILSKKIKNLETTLSRITCPNKLSTILGGTTALSFSTLWAIALSYISHVLYTEFTLKKFKNIYFERNIINDLPFITINQKEKDYLDTFSFENIHCRYVTDRHYPIPEDTIKNEIARLSPREKEKIPYIALRSTINNLKWQIPLVSLVGITPIIISIAGSVEFLKKLMYEIKIRAELKHNQVIYRLLKKERKNRNLCPSI